MGVNSIHSIYTDSVIAIGERKENAKRIIWNQLYDTSEIIDEENMRLLLSSISTHIIRKRIKNGSARKFKDGKLMFFELQHQNDDYLTVYALYTLEDNIKNNTKKAFKAIIQRGGLYTARRFFYEFLELMDDTEKLEGYSNISVNSALNLISNYDTSSMDYNQLARVISLVNHSSRLDFNVLEKIYLLVYETIQLFETEINDDADEFLDAAFITATRYEEHVFHLAMELYKKIIPIAIQNMRYNLATTCRLRICQIYRDKFPGAGELMLKQLDSVKELDMNELTKKNLETYWVMRGYAYYENFQFEETKENFHKAIEIAEHSVSSPKLMAEAYGILASLNFQEFRFREASRQFLTASAIAFSTGDINMSDKYLQRAGLPDIYMAQVIANVAIANRMDGKNDDAEFNAWESLRLLIKAYIHSLHGTPSELTETAERILSYSESILVVKGKRRKNGKIIRSVRQLIDKIIWQTLKQGSEIEIINKILFQIEENIPLVPPTFMLLANDGRLIIMGEVTDSGWEESGIQGVILSGIISAITSLISEVSDNSSTLKTIDAGNYQIMLEQGVNTISVLLVDRELPVFRRRLETIMQYVEDEYKDIIDRWDGSYEHFDELVEIVELTFAPSIIALQM